MLLYRQSLSTTNPFNNMSNTKELRCDSVTQPFLDIHDIWKKARRVLGTIYHRITKNTNDSRIILRLYTALVRPHLEYAAQVWNPHLEKDIQCLEKVQQFALRMCAKDYHATYENLLDLFFVPSLRNRRLCLSLCTFYCIVNGLVHFPQQNLVHPIMSSIRNFYPHAFIVPYFCCNALTLCTPRSIASRTRNSACAEYCHAHPRKTYFGATKVARGVAEQLLARHLSSSLNAKSER